MSGPRYWISIVARENVLQARAGGYVEVNHGRAGALERMRPDDGIAFYSPRADADARTPLQAFTAIGRIAGGDVYQVVASGTGAGVRFRRRMSYVAAAEAPIRPLIETLRFIRSKAHWGAPFRFGVVRIEPDDFARIATAMGCEPAREFGITEGPATTVATALHT